MALFPLDFEHFEQDLLIIMFINSLCLRLYTPHIINCLGCFIYTQIALEEVRMATVKHQLLNLVLPEEALDIDRTLSFPRHFYCV